MEPNPRSKRSRANVSAPEMDGGVYDVAPNVEVEVGSVPAGQDAAHSIDPAIQPNDFPVDSYTSKPGKQISPPIA